MAFQHCGLPSQGASGITALPLNTFHSVRPQRSLDHSSLPQLRAPLSLWLKRKSLQTHLIRVDFFIAPTRLDTLQTPILDSPFTSVLAPFQLLDKALGRLNRPRADRHDSVLYISCFARVRVDEEILPSALLLSRV